MDEYSMPPSPTQIEKTGTRSLSNLVPLEVFVTATISRSLCHPQPPAHFIFLLKEAFSTPCLLTVVIYALMLGCPCQCQGNYANRSSSHVSKLWSVPTLVETTGD